MPGQQRARLVVDGDQGVDRLLAQQGVHLGQWKRRSGSRRRHLRRERPERVSGAASGVDTPGRRHGEHPDHGVHAVDRHSPARVDDRDEHVPSPARAGDGHSPGALQRGRHGGPRATGDALETVLDPVLQRDGGRSSAPPAADGGGTGEPGCEEGGARTGQQIRPERVVRRVRGLPPQQTWERRGHGCVVLLRDAPHHELQQQSRRPPVEHEVVERQDEAVDRVGQAQERESDEATLVQLEGLCGEAALHLGGGRSPVGRIPEIDDGPLPGIGPAEHEDGRPRARRVHRRAEVGDPVHRSTARTCDQVRIERARDVDVRLGDVRVAGDRRRGRDDPRL